MLDSVDIRERSSDRMGQHHGRENAIKQLRLGSAYRRELSQNATRLLLLSGVIAVLTGCGNPSPTVKGSAPPSSPIPTPQLPVGGASASPTAEIPGNQSEFTKTLESKLGNVVSKMIAVPAEAVRCPNRTQVKIGDRFNCQVTSDGKQFDVAIELTDESGQFSWSTKGLLVLAKLEEFIKQQVKDKNNTDVTVNCGGKLRVAEAGTSFECKVTEPQGQTRSAKVTVKDEQGNVDISFL